MQVKIQKLHPDAKLPEIGSAGAACVDLIATNIIISDDNTEAIVHLGFATEIPVGYKAVIVPRSSFTLKGWVMQNSPAQIDADYRGEWILKFEAIPQRVHPTTFTAILKMDYYDFPYVKDQRVAQVYFEKVIDFTWEPVLELETTERGKGGFGSTGK